MEKTKDAAYQIMLNDKLRNKFLKIYEEFPEFYDKYAHNTGNVRRCYSHHYQDYGKVFGVLVAVSKDEELKERVGKMLGHYFFRVFKDEMNKYDYSQGFQAVVGEAAEYTLKCHKYMIPWLKSTYTDSAEKFYGALAPGIVTAVDTTFKETERKKKQQFYELISKTKLDEGWNYLYEAAFHMFCEAKWLYAGENVGTIKTEERLIEDMNRIFEETDNEEQFVEDLAENLGRPKAFSDICMPQTEDKTEMTNKAIRANRVANETSTKAKLSLAQEYGIGICEYHRQGIDICSLLMEATLTPKYIQDTIKAVKRRRELRGLPTPSDAHEWCIVSREIVRMILVDVLIGSYKKAISENYAKPERKKKKNDNTLLKLKEENDKLKADKLKHDAEIQVLKSQFNGERKELLAQIYNLQKELEQTEEEPEKVVCEEPEEKTETRKETIEMLFSEKDFRRLANERRIAVWGMREEVAKKLAERFPDLTFIPTKTKLLSAQTDNYDGVIMALNFTSHSKYYLARDTFKNAGIPIVALEREKTNDYWLFKAGEELKNKLEQLGS